MPKYEFRQEVFRTILPEKVFKKKMDRDDPGKELMIRLQQGDDSAFHEIVMQYQQKVHNYAFRSLHDRHKAEDIAQETFLRVFKAYNRWRPEANFSTWLFTIAHRLCLNEIRSRSRERKALHTVHGTGETDILAQTEDKKRRSPLKKSIQHEQSALLHSVIQKLPEKQKQAILLHKFEGLSYKEVAEVLDLSLEAVRSLLVRARKNIHKHLSPHLTAGESGNGADLS